MEKNDKWFKDELKKERDNDSNSQYKECLEWLNILNRACTEKTYKGNESYGYAMLDYNIFSLDEYSKYTLDNGLDMYLANNTDEVVIGGRPNSDDTKLRIFRIPQFEERYAEFKTIDDTLDDELKVCYSGDRDNTRNDSFYAEEGHMKTLIDDMHNFDEEFYQKGTHLYNMIQDEIKDITKNENKNENKNFNEKSFNIDNNPKNKYNNQIDNNPKNKYNNQIDNKIKNARIHNKELQSEISELKIILGKNYQLKDLNDKNNELENEKNELIKKLNDLEIDLNNYKGEDYD